MKNNIKIILYIIGTILFIYLLSRMYPIFEGYQSTYGNLNYSQTVDLPINFPFSCKNFCGPNNKCALTGKQCTADYDCTGCQINPNWKQKVDPYYRELDSTYHQMDTVFVGSKNNLPISNYSGNENNKWAKSFNEALKLYNRKETYNNPLDDFEKKILINYPTSISMTGEYYQTTPPAYGE